MALATGQITINNIKEAISVVFSKDNHVFAGGVSSALASSVDINVNAYIGTQEVAYTFGSITPAAPTGLTITPSSINKKITLTSTTALTQPTGTFNVEVIVNGVTVNKALSYVISTKGDSGPAGPKGDTGESAKSVDINASSVIFKSTDGGATFSPDNIILTPIFQGGVTYLNWQYSIDGGSTWTTITTQNGLSIDDTSKALTIAKTSTLFTALITNIVFRVNTDSATIYDTTNITKIYDVVDLSQQAIFNKLTNNGEVQGLFLDAGKLYLNGEYLRVANLVSENALIQNGYINTAVIQDASIVSAKISSLAADKIDADTLSAITANVGTLTAGLLKNAAGTTYLDLTNGTFKLGSALEYNGTILSIAANVDLSANTSVFSKVSQSAYDAKMGTFTGTVSEIKQTADAVTLAFDNQVVGGRNFLLKSGIPITTSDYLMTAYYLTEAIPAGTEVTLTIKGTLAATRTTFGAYNSGGNVILTNNMTNMGGGIYQKTFTWTVGASSNAYVSIYQMTSGQTGTSTIEWVKLEKGIVATDWNQAPEELVSGITTIAANGVTVGQQGSTIVSNLHNEGLSIMDGETKVATFNGGLSEIPNVRVATISGNVVNSTGAQTLNVGVGYTYSTITAALNALNGQYGNAKFIKDNGTVLVNVYGSISDNVMLYGWTGGTLEIRFQTGAKLIGRIYVFSSTSRIIINGISGADRGVIQHNGTNNQLIDSYASSSLIIRNLNFNKGSSAGAWAIRLSENSKAYITDCDFGQCQYGIMGYTGSIIFAYNNRGSCTGNGMWISDSILTARGTIPNPAPYTSIGAYHAIGTLTGTASTYSPPAQVPTDFTQTFDPIDIYTTVYGSSTRSTYYVDVAVQGRWNTMGSAQVGYFVFGSAVKTFMGEGTVKSVKLKIRRENSTHGLTTDIKPIPYNFTPTSSFVSTVCTRGEWSNQVSIDPATIGASSTTFSFYSSVVDSGYAKFDAAQLEVVVTKMV